MHRVIYLHGFASAPSSTKAQFFRRKFSEVGVKCDVLQLDSGDFEGLTITGQLRVVADSAGGERVTLMGSSLGGYVAALYAARHPEVERLVLLAPAFQFPSRWKHRFTLGEMEQWRNAGTRSFFHYGYKADRPLGYGFVEDAEQYEDEPDFQQPALILHGLRDDVVPVEVSREFAARHPNAVLRTLDSGHELTDCLDLLWKDATAFLGFQIQ